MIDRYPKPDAGSQLRKGKSCWAYAAVNAAISAGMTGATTLSPDAVFNAACAIDGIPETDNRDHGTLGSAVVKVIRSMLGDDAGSMARISPQLADVFLITGSAVMVAIRHNYAKVGLIGNTMRRLPEVHATGHAIALVGFDAFHRTGIFRKRPCFLVCDSARRGRLWLAQADFLKDCFEAWAFSPNPSSLR